MLEKQNRSDHPASDSGMPDTPESSERNFSLEGLEIETLEISDFLDEAMVANSDLIGKVMHNMRMLLQLQRIDPAPGQTWL